MCYMVYQFAIAVTACEEARPWLNSFSFDELIATDSSLERLYESFIDYEENRLSGPPSRTPHPRPEDVLGKDNGCSDMIEFNAEDGPFTK